MEEVATAQIDYTTAASQAISGKVSALIDSHLAYSRQSFGETSRFLQALAGTQSVQSSIELQADYLRGQSADFISQTEKVTILCRDIAEEAMKPVRSAAERASVFAG